MQKGRENGKDDEIGESIREMIEEVNKRVLMKVPDILRDKKQNMQNLIHRLTLKIKKSELNTLLLNLCFREGMLTDLELKEKQH